MSYPYDGSPAGNEWLATHASGIGPNGIHLTLEPDHVRLSFAIAEADIDGRVKDAYDEGFEEGEADHVDDYDDGYGDGFDEGKEEGHAEGYDLGFEAGLKEGKKRRP